MMTGMLTQEHPTEVAVPASLVRLASEAGLSMRQTLMAVDMHRCKALIESRQRNEAGRFGGLPKS
jgi:hypothetical protein